MTGTGGTSGGSHIRGHRTGTTIRLGGTTRTRGSGRLDLGRGTRGSRGRLLTRVGRLVSTGGLSHARNSVNCGFASNMLIGGVCISEAVRARLITNHLTVIRFGRSCRIIPTNITSGVALQSRSIIMLGGMVTRSTRSRSSPCTRFIVPSSLV